MIPDRMDGWASHQYPLIQAVMHTTGPIVEFGCGNYSTPLLSVIARRTGRQFVMVSSDREWAQAFTRYADDYLLLPGAGKNPGAWLDRGRLDHLLAGMVTDDKIGLLFMDNEQAVKDRVQTVLHCADHCRMVVMHDAQVTHRGGQWEQLQARFRHAYEWTGAKPRATTALLSNTINAAEWFTT